jgi:hypothetical protein
MDFSKLSFADAPKINVPPPGPKSREYLEYQFSHEGSAVSYRLLLLLKNWLKKGWKYSRIHYGNLKKQYKRNREKDRQKIIF